MKSTGEAKWHDQRAAVHGRNTASLSPTLRLKRDVIGVTTIKLVILGLIYVLFFWSPSHRSPVDAVTHIAGPSSALQAR